MAKLLTCAYAAGVVSSRQIARRLETDVAFRMLAAGNVPKHRTVREFRHRHLTDFKALFVRVVALAGEAGLASFGKLSISGTKVRSTARRRAMNRARLRCEQRRLDDEVAALVRAEGAADTAEDMRLGRGFAATSCRRPSAGGPVGGHHGGAGAIGGETPGGSRFRIRVQGG